MMLLKTVLILTLPLMILVTAKASTNKQCVADFQEMQKLSKTPLREIAEDQWPFINTAYRKAESVFIDDSFYTRMENLGEKGIIVTLCDGDSGYENGNCFEYYFKKEKSPITDVIKAKIVAIKKEWQQDMSEIEYKCEGYESDKI